MNRLPALIVALLAGLLLFGAWATLVGASWTEIGLVHDLLRYAFTMQRDLYRAMAGAVHGYKETLSAGPLLWLYGLSFVYGVFHAVGPGHGKLVISSYLVASGSRFRRGLWLTLASSLVQALSAILLVGVLAAVLGLAGRRIEAQAQMFEAASYGLIVAVGFWMLYGALRGGHHHHHGGADHAPGHSHDHDHGSPSPPVGARRHHLAAIILAVGIRPCSGAVLVLLFTLAQGIFPVGVGAALVMSLGTAITVAALALFTVVSRNAALKLARRQSRWEGWAQRAFAVGGSLVILAGGALFLLASLQQPPPL